jgi:hypothetical protein
MMRKIGRELVSPRDPRELLEVWYRIRALENVQYRRRRQGRERARLLTLS